MNPRATDLDEIFGLPDDSSEERKKGTSARQLRGHIGVSTKVSKKLVMAQVDINNALQDDNWGNQSN